MNELADMVKKTKKITLDGKSYILSELTMADWSELDVRSKDHKKRAVAVKRDTVIETAKKIYGDKLPDNLIDKAMAPLLPEEYEEYEDTFEGSQFMLWRSLVKRQPELTMDDVANIIPIHKIQEIVKQITGVKEPAKNVRRPAKRK